MYTVHISVSVAASVPVRPLLEEDQFLPGWVDIVHDDHLVPGVAGVVEIPPTVHGILDVGAGVGPGGLLTSANGFINKYQDTRIVGYQDNTHAPPGRKFTDVTLVLKDD